MSEFGIESSFEFGLLDLETNVPKNVPKTKELIHHMLAVEGVQDIPEAVTEEVSEPEVVPFPSSFSLANPTWPPHSTCPGRNRSTRQRATYKPRKHSLQFLPTDGRMCVLANCDTKSLEPEAVYNIIIDSV